MMLMRGRVDSMSKNKASILGCLALSGIGAGIASLAAPGMWKVAALGAVTVIGVELGIRIFKR